MRSLQRVIALERKIHKLTAYQRVDVEQRDILLNDFVAFKRYFWPLVFGNEYQIRFFPPRIPLETTLTEQFMRVYKGEITRQIIKAPPRHGKTGELVMFVGWTWAKHPRSNYLYVSYNLELAKRATGYVRDLVKMPQYQELFEMFVRKDVDSRQHFANNFGGEMMAAGAGGTIMGLGAGIRYAAEFDGLAIIDDPHKFQEVHSDTMRENIIEWYPAVFRSRVNNGIKTRIIVCAQELHERDLPQCLYNGLSGEEWDRLAIPALDEESGAALNPDIITANDLLAMKKNTPYIYYSQYQQCSQPPGGSLYSEEDFTLLDSEPQEMLTGFITIDTAETDKTYNDATVFSYWIVHKIEFYGKPSPEIGLHWLYCHEVRVEPAELEDQFRMFYSRCLGHKVKPELVAIEKKSTGTFLYSLLKKVPGLRIHPIERPSNAGSKSTRFIRAQGYIKKNLISLPHYAEHTQMCLTHMEKITANNTHEHDDIADTCADAIQLALTEEGIVNTMIKKQQVLTIPNYSPFHKVKPIQWT